jgi:hypothetical protein
MNSTPDAPELPRARLLAFIREHAPGKCKMLSLGDKCTCPLCDVDRLAALATRQPLPEPLTNLVCDAIDGYKAGLGSSAPTGGAK